MKIRLSDENTENVVVIDPEDMAVLLTSVFKGVTFMTERGAEAVPEALTVTMKDGGYELMYVTYYRSIYVNLKDGIMDWGVL